MILLSDLTRYLGLLFILQVTVALLTPLTLRRSDLPSTVSDAQSKFFIGPNRSPPANFGKAAKIVGDINKDGFDDIIVGAYHDSPLNRQYSGSVYVIYGRADGWEHVDINNLNSVDGFVIAGAYSNDLTGSAVGAADVNGDGFVDVLIGSIVSSPIINGAPRYYAGATYIVYGKAQQNATVDLLHLTAAEGVKIIGATASDYSGSGLAGIGDFNGDGYSDIVIGAYYTTRNGRTNTGSAYIVFGRPDFSKEVDLAALTTSTGFEAIGARSGAYTGAAVAKAGDINHDGIADVVIGACFDGPKMEGTVYILFGKKQSVWSNLDLANLLPSDGIAITGTVAGDNLGYSVSTAGDFNGDGIDDVILGANFVEPGLFISNGGAAYVVYGSASIASIPSVGDMTASQGFSILGHGTNYNLGFVVAGGGDIDKDGYDDLIVGANQQTVDGVTFVGVVYVIAGKETAKITTVDTNDFTADDGYLILGSTQGELFGSSLSLGGDVNGDGYADLVIGAPNKYGGKGFVFLELGNNSHYGDSTVPVVTTSSPSVEPTATPFDPPTAAPTLSPSVAPTLEPSQNPTITPSETPSHSPTPQPSRSPTALPTVAPTAAPTPSPTVAPTVSPTANPSRTPTANPTAAPSRTPTTTPSAIPTATPTAVPTATPTAIPTPVPELPSEHPTVPPTYQPTINSNQVVAVNVTITLMNVLTASLSPTGSQLVVDGMAVVSGLPTSSFGGLKVLAATEVTSSFRAKPAAIQLSSSTWTLIVEMTVEAPLRFFPLYVNQTAALCSLLQQNLTLINQVNPGNVFVAYIHSHASPTYGPELAQMTLPPPPHQRVAVSNCSGIPIPSLRPTAAPSPGIEVRSNSNSDRPLISGSTLIAVIVCAIVVGLGLCCGCGYYLYVTGAIAALTKKDPQEKNGDDASVEKIVASGLNETQLESQDDIEGLPRREISLESFLMENSFDLSDNRSVGSFEESLTLEDHRTSLSFI